MVIQRSFVSILALACLTYFFIDYLTIMLYLPALALPCWLSGPWLVFCSTDCHRIPILLQAPLLDIRNHRRSYRHLRSLISVLDTVFPAVAEDPNFLDRSLLMEGVSLRANPCDLLDGKLGLQVEAAVVVRDAEFGDSVGLLVLTHGHDTEVAMAAGPRKGVFCDCIKVRT